MKRALPRLFLALIATLLALGLLGAIWFRSAAQPAAFGMGALMVGALVMHIKVKDPVKKSLPASAVLAMCLAIAVL